MKRRRTRKYSRTKEMTGAELDLLIERIENMERRLVELESAVEKKKKDTST